MNVYKYDKLARYQPGSYYKEKTINLKYLDIAVTQKETFRINPLGIFDNYLNPDIKSDFVAKEWLKGGMQFYQNQVNFAVTCASTGCGVSYVHHLNYPDEMIKSIYLFHLYYQVRRVLSELEVPLPTDKNFNPFNNYYNKKSFQRLCSEFKIDPNTDFRQKLDSNQGMGSLYRYKVGNFYPQPFVPGFTSFSHNSQVPLLYIRQRHGNAYTTFVLDIGGGFTQSGVERLNESIRVYVWCVLGSQAQTRSNIIGKKGTSFDSQKQFLANLEDSINSTVDLPASIKRYQDSLKYARSKVDFVVGYGLYMLPSDLQLRIGQIKNFNNNIVIAETNKISMGFNPAINETDATDTVPTFISMGFNPAINETDATDTVPTFIPVVSQVASQPITHLSHNPVVSSNHKVSKVVLTGGLLIAGLFGLYYFK